MTVKEALETIYNLAEQNCVDEDDFEALAIIADMIERIDWHDSSRKYDADNDTSGEK